MSNKQGGGRDSKVINFISNLNEKFTDSINNFKQKYGYLLKPFLIILLINIVAIIPIMIGNVNYVDDLGRTYGGYRGWDNYSRYISNFLSIIIHTTKTLTDISPLTQIIAVAFTSLSSIILIYLFNRGRKVNFSSIMATIPLALCPYFLECLSFKFDAPYMALSILVSIVPFLFFKDTKKGKFSFTLAVIIGTLVMCMTYQTSSSIMIMVALFLAFKEWSRDEDGIICTKEETKRFKKVFYFLIYTAIGYLIGLLIYKIFIVKPFDTYVSSEMFSLKELIPGYLSNLKKYYKYVISDFRKLWIILILAITVMFMIVQLIKTDRKKLPTFILSIGLLGICAVYVFGIYTVMVKPSFRPRACYAIGTFVSLICINICNTDFKLSISKILVIALGWCFIVFSFTYGNALIAQNDYIDFRVQNVINGLNELDIMNNDDIKTISINGDIGLAPQIVNNKGYTSIIDRLIRISFGDDSSKWGYRYILDYYGIENIKVNVNKCEFEDELDIFKDTMYYTIKTDNENYILIILK